VPLEHFTHIVVLIILFHHGIQNFGISAALLLIFA